MLTWQRAAVGSLFALAIAIGGSGAIAGELAVPANLQAELLLKIASYDRSMAGRAAGTVRVLVVAKAGEAGSTRAATQIAAELGANRTVGEMPVEVTVIELKKPDELRPPLHLAVLFLMPGFSAREVDVMTAGLGDKDLLTVAADATYVERGVVLGFDLVAGKPKLVFHRGAARRHKVSIPAEVMRLMKVIE